MSGVALNKSMAVPMPKSGIAEFGAKGIKGVPLKE